MDNNSIKFRDSVSINNNSKKTLINSDGNNHVAVNNFIQQHRCLSRCVTSVIYFSYVTSLAYIASDFVMRSRSLDPILMAFHIKDTPHDNVAGEWAFNITAAIAVGIANLTFSPSKVSRTLMNDYRLYLIDHPQDYFIQAIFWDEAKKNKILTTAFITMAASSAMIGIFALEMLRPYVSKQVYDNVLYPLGCLILIASGILYYFFFNFKDVIQYTQLGWDKFCEVLKTMISRDANISMHNRAVAGVAALQMIAGGLEVIFRMALGAFIFMQSMGASVEYCYVAALVAAIATAVTVPATRFRSAYYAFYMQTELILQTQAENSYKERALYQKGMTFLKDSTLPLVLGTEYIVSKNLSLSLSYSLGINVLLIIMANILAAMLLYMMLAPAIKQKTINAIIKPIDLQQTVPWYDMRSWDKCSMAATFGCLFYRFSRTVSLIYILELLLPYVFNTQKESGDSAIVGALSVAIFLSVAGYEYHQPKVKDTLKAMTASGCGSAFFCCTASNDEGNYNLLMDDNAVELGRPVSNNVSSTGSSTA